MPLKDSLKHAAFKALATLERSSEVPLRDIRNFLLLQHAAAVAERLAGDREVARRVGEVIRGMAQSVVVVTHDLDLLDGFERVLVVDGGRVVEDGPADASVAAYRKLMADR